MQMREGACLNVPCPPSDSLELGSDAAKPIGTFIAAVRVDFLVHTAGLTVEAAQRRCFFELVVEGRTWKDIYVLVGV